MIFLDVDDTLVLYRDDVTPHPYGVLMGLGFRVNHELVDRVLAHLSPDERVVVWSGGGLGLCRDSSAGLRLASRPHGVSS